MEEFCYINEDAGLSGDRDDEWIYPTVSQMAASIEQAEFTSDDSGLGSLSSSSFLMMGNIPQQIYGQVSPFSNETLDDLSSNFSNIEKNACSLLDTMMGTFSAVDPALKRRHSVIDDVIELPSKRPRHYTAVERSERSARKNKETKRTHSNTQDPTPIKSTTSSATKSRKSSMFPVLDGKALSNLLKNEEKFNSNYVLVDCRYPYEYEGGHVKNAINIYDFKRQAMPKFFPEEGEKKLTGKILIFYCEFSQKRGPSMAYSIRQYDRKHNCYPQLDYPKIFILERGYSRFFQEGEYLDFCTPPNYVTMLKHNHSLYLQHRKRRLSKSASQ